MNLDFEKALTYISNDSQWGNKLIAGAGLMLASFAVFALPVFTVLTNSIIICFVTFLVSLLFSFVITLGIFGYLCETAHNRIMYPENSTLPDWSDFGKLILLGFKYFAGYILYMLPVCLVFILFGLLLGFCIFIFRDGLSGSFAFSFLFLTFIGAMLLFLYILTLVFLPLMMSNFFKDKKILSFIDFKNAFSMLKNNVSNYFVLILLFIAVTMFIQILCSFLFVTVIGLIFLPLVFIYANYVVADLCAQFVNSKNDVIENNDVPSC